MGQSSRGGLPFNWGRIPIGFALRNPNSFISNVAFKYLARRPLGVPFEIFKGVNLHWYKLSWFNWYFIFIYTVKIVRK